MRRERTPLNIRSSLVRRRKRSPGHEIRVGNWTERDSEWERMDAIRLEMREDTRRVFGSEILERIKRRISSGSRVWSGSE